LVAATSQLGSHNRSTELLIPPPDIAWLWYCHRLAPKQYCNYCQKEFGRVIEANPPFSLAFPEDTTDNDSATCATALTKILWNERYPNESFFYLNHHVDNSVVIDAPIPLVHGFDLLESTSRQSTFLWQVSGERFADDDFLEEGAQNYAKFLQLKPRAMERRMTLVPTYQIDLMWHTHMLTSMEKYNEDCIRIMNSTMHHDDSLTDRSEGGILEVAYISTKSLWLSEYGEEYEVCGGMYRGEPPDEYFSAEWNPKDIWLPSVSHDKGILNGGATSTSPGVTQWTPTSGLASDLLPAFIPTSEQTKYGVRKLSGRKNYVLGRTQSTTGYYHLETREAHTILLARVEAQIKTLQTDICCSKYCCGHPSLVSQYQKKLNAMIEARAVLTERLQAPAPTGATKTTQVRKSAVFTSNGVWLYPPVLFSCAGGACGGAVASAGVGGAGTYCWT
jgi:Glycine-rich domain-containing protein-like